MSRRSRCRVAEMPGTKKPCCSSVGSTLQAVATLPCLLCYTTIAKNRYHSAWKNTVQLTQIYSTYKTVRTMYVSDTSAYTGHIVPLVIVVADLYQYRIRPECPSSPFRGRSVEQIDIEGRGILSQERAS